MDSLLTAAARALSIGDPLGALARVALREDAPALALRGIAMAQLGELARASELLRRAARAFEPSESRALARTFVARAEVLLAMRDFSPLPELDAVLATFEAHGDRVNGLHTRLLSVRRALLLGQIDDAEAALARLELTGAPPMLSAIAELAAADIALRRIRPDLARERLSRAHEAALRSRIAALIAEVERASAQLAAPAARACSENRERLLTLDEVAELLACDALIVDACRRVVRVAAVEVELVTRPVLFALARVLASAWPQGAPRTALIAEGFGIRRPNESHRARLRVEIGRLRRKLAPLAAIHATADGFILSPCHEPRVVTLLPPIDGEAAALLALLADGEAWSTSALALALGTSQRTIQRALLQLQRDEKVSSVGRGRARRWLSPPASGFATTLLLPAFASNG